MTATIPTSTIAAGTWAIDPLHSSAEFRVRHFGIAWLRGQMTDFDLTFESSDAGSYSLTGSSTVDAIHTKNETLAGHLASPDFFDSALYPTIGFAAENIQFSADGSILVNGELTLRGVTQPVTLTGTWSGPIVDMSGADRIGIELEGDIDRHAYGISWNAPLSGGQDVLGAKVSLVGSFELVRQ